MPTANISDNKAINPDVHKFTQPNSTEVPVTANLSTVPDAHSSPQTSSKNQAFTAVTKRHSNPKHNPPDESLFQDLPPSPNSFNALISLPDEDNLFEDVDDTQQKMMEGGRTLHGASC